jgi:hypothetical protein
MYPECFTPHDMTKEVVDIWCLNMAVQTVHHAALILQHKLYEQREYPLELQRLTHAMQKYKKLLRLAIIDHLKKKI